MTGFVVDASVALAWHFEDERQSPIMPLLERTLAEPIFVPPHWQIEVANGALVGERKYRASIEQTAKLWALFAMMQIVVDADGENDVIDRVLPLARAHGLTVYDALYLELAERRGLPLATRDRQLVRAARVAGVAIIGEEA